MPNLPNLFSIIKSPQRKNLFRWIFSFKKNYLLETHTPWITFDATDYIVSHLPPQSKIFEYGSGGSTLLWQDLGSTCVSVEHDPDWFKIMCGYLNSSNNITYKLIPPIPSDALATQDYSDPRLYLSADPKFQTYNFTNYVSYINNFPNEYFDLILIDGRARPSCIMHSVPKVKPGGMLVLDNSEREYYTSKAGSFIKHFECKKFPGLIPTLAHTTQTSIYIRQKFQ